MGFVELTDKEHRQILKVIHGALKSTIDAHGPIDAYWIGSAGKRIIGALKSHDRAKAKKEQT